MIDARCNNSLTILSNYSSFFEPAHKLLTRPDTVYYTVSDKRIQPAIKKFQGLKILESAQNKRSIARVRNFRYLSFIQQELACGFETVP